MFIMWVVHACQSRAEQSREQLGAQCHAYILDAEQVLALAYILGKVCKVLRNLGHRVHDGFPFVGWLKLLLLQPADGLKGKDGSVRPHRGCQR